MTKEEMTAAANKTLHSARRLCRLMDLDAPAVVIERERLICMRHLHGIMPDPAITAEAASTLDEPASVAALVALNPPGRAP